MIRVAISGACGRMGKRLVEFTSSQPDMRVVAALEAPNHPDLGRDAGEVAGIKRLDVPVTVDLPAGVDVLIEFTAPAPTVAHAQACAAAGAAIVIGTTGLSAEQKAAIAALSARIPVLLAPNMSVGVNVAFEAAAMLAKTLGPGYDVEIVEMHHNKKKDAPSGTALGFAERIAGALERDLAKDAVYGREGMVGERKPNEIGIHAVRGGDIVGEHRIIFSAPGERIELTHMATTRDVFAHGAVRLARILAGKPAGMHTVKDLLLGVK